ncbi:MAG: hypothetical protein LUF04_06875 [Bacteroides sp.]|nr:hypothetical protein [Bacteroides sp.]
MQWIDWGFALLILSIYGKKVKKLCPLADIFKDLKESNASLEDMVTIFGKIGGNAGMMFLVNYEKLKSLASENRVSHSISADIAKVKQETTNGLWYQVKSQFSESFMQGYEMLEPQIQGMLRGFLAKFSAPEFARGLAEIGRLLLDIFSVLRNIATWFTRNFHWLEPLIFSTVITTRLFKLAGALVALGFLGKQSAATAGMKAIGSLPFLLPPSKQIAQMSFTDKRMLVTARNMYGMQGGLGAIFGRQVAIGNGLLCAASSIGVLGGTVLGAVSAFTALAGALGWVTYKTWKVKQAKDAVMEEIKSNQKFRYSSIEALHDSLRKTHEKALATKGAIDKLTEGRTIKEESGFGFKYSKRWWMAFFSNFNREGINLYKYEDTYQAEIKKAIKRIADKHGQERLNAAWEEFGALSIVQEIDAFLLAYRKKYGQSETLLDKSLYYTDANGLVRYHEGLGNKGVADVTKTPTFMEYINDETLPFIKTGAAAYRRAIANYAGAKEAIEKAEPKFFEEIKKLGFIRNVKGEWI